MKTITASDRSNLIKLASGLPKGDKTRRAILAGLSKVSNWDHGFLGTADLEDILYAMPKKYHGVPLTREMLIDICVKKLRKYSRAEVSEHMNATIAMMVRAGALVEGQDPDLGAVYTFVR